MSNRKTFTEEELKELLTNPNTHSVTDNGTIRYTFEFKQYVWNELQKGNKPKAIFEAAGYDYKLIGRSRLDAYVRRVREEGFSEEGLRDTTPKLKHKPMQSKIDEKAVIELQEKVRYMEQQIDFLKKISALDASERLKK